MIRRFAPAWALLAVAVAGCPASRQAGGPLVDPDEAWERASARIAADPADGMATLEAARLALFARNDSKSAKALASEAARAPALTADARLLLAYLAWRDRDYPAVAERTMQVIDADPGHLRAEVAVWMLEWIRQDLPGFDGLVEPWLERLQADPRGSPGLRRVLGRIALHLAAIAKDRQRYERIARETVGALTEVRVACPFGLFPALAFDRAQPPELREGPLRGEYGVEGPAHRRTVTVRGREFPDAWLRCDDWPDGGGVAFFEADVEMAAAGDRTLTVYGEGSWRVTVDGEAVLERRGLTEVGRRLRSARIHLTEGLHRIRVKLASDTDDSDIWMTLGGDGPEEEAPDRLVRREGRPLGAHLERLAYAAYLLHDYPYDDAPGARSAAEALMVLAPRSADGMYVLGEAVEADRSLPMKKRRSVSRSLQRKLVELDPDHLLGRYALGFSAQQEDRHEAALEHFERASAINPDYYWAHYRRFEALRELGWDREARQSLDKALGLSTNPTLLKEAASWFAQRHALSRREALRDKLEERTAAVAPALTATRARDRGDPPSEGAALVRRAEARPWDPSPWRRLFEISWASGRAEAGPLARWKELRPFDPQIARRRAELEVSEGRSDAAASALRELLAERPERLTDRRLLALLEGRDLERDVEATAALVADYRRAVATDPKLAAWPEHEAVYLLDRRIDRIWADGGGFRETHRVTLLQNKSAIDEAGEWRPPRGAVVLEMRTLKADGRVLEPELGQRKGDLSFSGLVPGDVIEIRHLQSLTPDVPGGGAYDRYYLRFNSRPIWRGELDVVTPADAPLTVLSRADAPPPGESVEGDRRTYRWRVNAASPVISEPYQAPYQEWLAHVDYAYRVDELPRRRRDQLLDRLRRGARPTRDLAAHATQLLQGVDGGPHDRASALFRWVRDEVDAAARQGRLLGVEAASVLAKRQGNRTLLLSALLDAAGISHRLLIARATDEPIKSPPTPSLFRYTEPVLEVPPERPGGAPLHLAPSGDHALPGWLPEDLRGAEALVVADGPVQVERLPETGGEAWTVRGELSADAGGGDLSGRLTVEGVGESTADVRRFLPRIPAQQRKQVIERALAGVLPGLTLEAVTFSDLEDVDRPLRLELTVRLPGALQRVKGPTGPALRLARLFSTPVSSVIGRGTAPGRYLQRAERKQTLMTRPLRESLDVTVTFPPALGASLTHAQTSMHSGAWGRVAHSWSPDGRGRFRLRRTYDVGLHRVPPESHAAFAEAMSTMDRAQSGEVLFQVTP